MPTIVWCIFLSKCHRTRNTRKKYKNIFHKQKIDQYIPSRDIFNNKKIRFMNCMQQVLYIETCNNRYC